MTRLSEKRPPLALLWPQKTEQAPGPRKIPPFRWGKHRVRLYAVPHSPGRSPGTPCQTGTQPQTSEAFVAGRGGAVE